VHALEGHTGALIIILAIAYVAILFLVLLRSENSTTRNPRRRAAIYGLSTGLCVAGWIFYGAEGFVADNDWRFLANYLSPLLIFTLFFPVWLKIGKVAHRENVGSLADFMASRYGKSRILGPLVACVAIFGTMPYTALQLKSMISGWRHATGQQSSEDLALLVLTGLFIVFAIAFGTRHPSASERNQGLMRVVAIGAVVKLATMAVAAIVPLATIVMAMRAGTFALPAHTPFQPGLTFLNSVILVFAAIFCVPRQFYAGFVELQNPRDLVSGRWYILGSFVVTGILTTAIWLHGAGQLHGMVPHEPHALDDIERDINTPLVYALSYVGGTFTAVALLTLEVMALAAMLSNELALPLLARLRWKSNRQAHFGPSILMVRRLSIAGIVVLGGVYYRYLSPNTSIFTMFDVSMSAVAQFFPALAGSVFWRRGHAQGAVWGIAAGFGIWALGIALPTFEPSLFRDLFAVSSAWQSTGLYAQITLCSLAVNLAIYVAVSLQAKPSLVDRVQAAAFVDAVDPRATDRVHRGTVRDLKAVVSQFLGPHDTLRAFEQLSVMHGVPLQNNDAVDSSLLISAERMLAGVIGSALAHTVIGWQTESLPRADGVGRLLDDAASAIQFNRELLHSALDNLDQGVSVVDADQRLVAWNKRYVGMFGFPRGFLYVGRPIAEVLHFGLDRIGVRGAEAGQRVERRLQHIRARNPFTSERTEPDGSVLKVVASPMSGGRYVTSFTDVTELRHAALALSEANEALEDRVTRRTRELTEAMAALSTAKAVAEQATSSQTRFLAAASHDVLQPLQAARLFIGTLTEELQGSEKGAVRELLSSTDLAIEAANRLLRALLNLSRLEIGGNQPEIKAVDIGALFRDLQREFEMLAREKGLSLRVVPGKSKTYALSNPDLLRSVLQNLVSNAIRYTASGKILVGCRHNAQGLRLEIHDTGPGISPDSIHSIFQEFVRLPHGGDGLPGTGLGLSIAKRICDILGHALTVRSLVGRGSMFAVTLQRAAAKTGVREERSPGSLPPGLRVLCIDNEPSILAALQSLLGRWGVTVSTASSASDAIAMGGSWDVILSDYQLGGKENGLDLIEAMGRRASVFALLVASPTEEILERAADLGVEVIEKPVAPIVLRMFLARSPFETVVPDASGGRPAPQ
jgi:signal transduction histidine kinase/Na+/proline symporter